MKKMAWIAAFLTIPASATAQSNGGGDAAVNSITPDDIIGLIGVMAHDSMRGRETPSPELDQVAEWVGEKFQSFGLKPGGDNGTFVQRYPLRVAQFDQGASTIRNDHGAELRFGESAVLLNGTAGENGIQGPVILMTGIPGEGVLGKSAIDGANVVWVMPTRPGPGMQEALEELFGTTAASVILVTPRPDAAFQQLLHQPSEPSLTADSEESSGPLFAEVRQEGASTLLADPSLHLTALREGPFALRPIEGVNLDITTANKVLQNESAPNTVGILEGSDPALKDQYVVFSAHMDHVGVGEPVDGDAIFNGADDDASGTAGIIELAEAFSLMNPRPRRSLIFLVVSGEEKGLWGSDYYARHPSVPVDQIVANLNADMIGRNWQDTIVVIGKEHSSLGTTLNTVNDAHPELNMTAIDDLWPRERFYFRSDHFNFARRGVPILFFFNGVHDQYHQPSDEVDLIDAEKEARIVQLMFYLGLEIAQDDEKPVWNAESYKQIVER